ncbi:hypothetical protein CRM22_005150 [Opisthorchis felineus]|uniref:Uncharacterized protein n=1 Tax=Opisthorchis felineus TaxID=147828 RepID=A0A4S2LSI5_OPIFE|nr:hypothetical protein CRM22_005150 [Opisthorchis felineus]
MEHQKGPPKAVQVPQITREKSQTMMETEATVPGWPCSGRESITHRASTLTNQLLHKLVSLIKTKNQPLSSLRYLILQSFATTRRPLLKAQVERSTVELIHHYH